MRSSLRTALSVPLLTGSTFMPSMPINAQGLNDQATTIQPSSLPRVGTIDERFQSYNVEMAEIIDGNSMWEIVERYKHSLYTNKEQP